MKRDHIIAIVVIAIAIGAFVSSLSESSSYALLNEAFENPGKEYHVIGTLDRSEPIIYEPTADPNLTKFTMQDSTGASCQVVLRMPKPQDMERSESIVLIGKGRDDGIFEAEHMLTKCPSKYEEETRIRNVDA